MSVATQIGAVCKSSRNLRKNMCRFRSTCRSLAAIQFIPSVLEDNVTFLNVRQRFESIWSLCLDSPSADPEGAVGDVMQLLEEFLDVEQIESAVSDDAAAFLFDMSNLGFSGLGWNVVVVSHAPESDEAEQWQASFLADQKMATDSTGICFHILMTEDRPKKNPFVPSSLEAVFLSAKDLRQVLRAELPKMKLAGLIREQTPVSRLCPFSTEHEALGAMFYGRRPELSMVVEELTTSIAIEGARRIGKTSLLKHGYRVLRSRFRKAGTSQAHYFNCLTWTNYRQACHMLAHKIDPRKEPRIDRGDQNIQYLLERCSHGGRRPLYLFFDEVDRLIELDATNAWHFFSLLAWAKDAGYVRFVLAGYRSIGQLVRGRTCIERSSGDRTDYLPMQTPLLQALATIVLGPLSRSETSSLTSEPLKSTDVRVDNEYVVEEAVWSATAGYPFLVQFFGDRMFRRGAERSTQHINVEDVKEIQESYELHNFLVTHFIENTISNGFPSAVERCAALLFAHAEEKAWKEQNFLRGCRDAQIPLGFDAFREVHSALENLCASQILACEHGQYRFAFPVMRQVLVDAYPDIEDIIPHLCSVS